MGRGTREIGAKERERDKEREREREREGNGFVGDEIR